MQGASSVDGSLYNSGTHVVLVGEFCKEAHMLNICRQFPSTDEFAYHNSTPGDGLMYHLEFPEPLQLHDRIRGMRYNVLSTDKFEWHKKVTATVYLRPDDEN